MRRIQMLRVWSVTFVIALWTAGGASAAQLRVPQDHATIQLAIDAAAPGDQIRVGLGQWCGATVTKRVELLGEAATVIGCAAGPSLFGLLRIGFFLPTSASSGTAIRGFTFDGRGVSNANTAPLAFAVFARDSDSIVVEHNLVLGTVQSITNTRGSFWKVKHNRIEGLTVFTCDGFCGGGDAIVFQQRTIPGARAIGNEASFNVITGVVPNNLNEFSMAGVLLIGQDAGVVTHNRIAIPDNPVAAGAGQGIVLTDACCGLGFAFLTTIYTQVLDNDGRDSEFAVVIEKDFGGGNGNSVGTVLRGNFGVNDINGSSTVVRNRSIRTFIQFP